MDTTCWALDRATAAWVAANNLSGVGQIYGVFVQRLNAVALALGRSPLRWEDAWTALGTALDPATVIHVAQPRHAAQRHQRRLPRPVFLSGRV